MTAITGKTYPVRDQLKALGGRWDDKAKAWNVPDDKADEARAIVAKGAASPAPVRTFTQCQVCGVKADRFTRIYRSGECRDCFEERKMGY